MLNEFGMIGYRLFFLERPTSNIER